MTLSSVNTQSTVNTVPPAPNKESSIGAFNGMISLNTDSGKPSPREAAIYKHLENARQLLLKPDSQKMKNTYNELLKDLVFLDKKSSLYKTITGKLSELNFLHKEKFEKFIAYPGDRAPSGRK